MPKNRDLKIWWIPQVPGKMFEYPVDSVQSAMTILDILAKYDIFQYENNIKPDFANTGGLLVYDEEYIEDNDPESGWVEWEDHKGQNIDELIKNWD